MKSQSDQDQINIFGTAESSMKTESNTNTIMKGQKNLKQEQNLIQMPIQKNKIQTKENELTLKFDPPLCMNCPKRRADRVCINKECGLTKYMQIICGKCHADLHANALIKPELDIEEYFIKLALFMNEQKDQGQSKKPFSIKTDQMNLVFNDLNKIREQLTSIKCQIKNDTMGYSSNQTMYSFLQDSITKALSSCDYQKLQEQIQSIKKSVLFVQNKFLWNDTNKKYESYLNSIQKINNLSVEAEKKISISLSQGSTISLEGLKMVNCYGECLTFLNKSGIQPDILPANGVFKIAATEKNEVQYYLDYKLDWDKKYKLRIKFIQNPKAYVMVGIMPLALVNSEYVFQVSNEYFCKRFFSSFPDKECGRIIKGEDLGNFPKEGSQIEMRVDLANNYMDFADFPYYNNINANHIHQKLQSKGPYVIAIEIFSDQTVIVESFETIPSIEAQ